MVSLVVLVPTQCIGNVRDENPSLNLTLSDKYLR